MKKFLLIFSLFFLCVRENLLAQVNVGDTPISWGIKAINDKIVVQKSFPIPDFDALGKEDIQDEKDGIPPRFGFLNRTSINLITSENKVAEEKEFSIWKIEIVCPQALSINFIFDKFWLPKGGKLYIYSTDKKQFISTFTNQNNKGTIKEIRGFATGLVYGDKVIIEYEQPIGTDINAIINVSGVIHGYRYIRIPDDINNKTSGFGASCTTQVNVNCPEGDNWQDEKRGVAMMLIGGTRLCSGSLINNTSQNGDLLFLTAFHCLGPPAISQQRDAVINPNLDDFNFWWEYESPDCTNPPFSSPPQGRFTNGGTVLANNTDTDFALIRLDPQDNPLMANPPVNVFFNGWDRTNNQPSGGVGIHHPKLDIKKISTYNITPIENTWCVPNPLNYWQVKWVPTVSGFSVIEGGSSGSPLFNSNGKIIGQLFGTYDCPWVTCPDPYHSENQKPVYGRISASWMIHPVLGYYRLKEWLDPGSTGATSIDGGYYSNCQSNLTIVDPINIFGDFQAGGSIHSSNTIASSANVVMKAGHYIQFLPGFSATSGANVSATIGVCTPRMIQAPFRQAVDNEVPSVVEQEKPELKLYPNPTSGNLNIEIKLVEAGEVTFRLLNLVGDEIRQWKTQFSDKGNYSLETSLIPYPPGVYWISVSGKNLHFNRKIVKN